MNWLAGAFLNWLLFCMIQILGVVFLRNRKCRGLLLKEKRWFQNIYSKVGRANYPKMIKQPNSSDSA